MLSRQRVLIIEDIYLIALDIQRILEGANAAEAIFARDFAEAGALSASFADFDLAIVNTPQPHDACIAAKLAAAGPGIVVCTASPAELAATPFAQAALVPKPFSDEQLLAACRKALAAREGARSSGS